MALVLVRDVKHGRGRVINTDNIFQCVEADGGVKIFYTEGSIGRDSVVVAGTLEDFARNVGAKQVG